MRKRKIRLIQLKHAKNGIRRWSKRLEHVRRKIREYEERYSRIQFLIHRAEESNALLRVK